MGYQPVLDGSTPDMAPKVRDNRARGLDMPGTRQIIAYRRIGGGSKVKSQRLTPDERKRNRAVRAERGHTSRNMPRTNAGIVPNTLPATVGERAAKAPQRTRGQAELVKLAKARLASLRTELAELKEQRDSGDNSPELAAHARTVKAKITHTKREISGYGVQVPKA